MIVHCVKHLVQRARDIEVKWHSLSAEGKPSLSKEKDKNMLPQRHILQWKWTKCIEKKTDICQGELGKALVWSLQNKQAFGTGSAGEWVFWEDAQHLQGMEVWKG